MRSAFSVLPKRAKRLALTAMIAVGAAASSNVSLAQTITSKSALHLPAGFSFSTDAWKSAFFRCQLVPWDNWGADTGNESVIVGLSSDGGATMRKVIMRTSMNGGDLTCAKPAHAARNHVALATGAPNINPEKVTIAGATNQKADYFCPSALHPRSQAFVQSWDVACVSAIRVAQMLRRPTDAG